MNVSKVINGNILTASVEGHVDTSTSPTLEAELMSSVNGIAEAVLDFDKLEYISSSGLRVLLKLKKAVPKVKLTNVNPEVYEILNITGFVEMLEVEKALRSISVEGCDKIGQGGNGAVYRLDDETIVKVYKPKVSRETVDNERQHAKTAFVHGIPTAIAYDVVRVNDAYGAVYELVDSDTLAHALLKFPERWDELLDKYTALVQTLKETHVSGDGFEKIQDVLHSRYEHLKEYMTPEDFELINSLVDCVPDSDTLIHGDLHPGNIMLQGDELILIDMAEMTTGASGYEILRIYYAMCGTASNPRYAKAAENSIGMSRDAINKFWSSFIKRYLKTDNPQTIDKFMQEMALKNVVNDINTLAKVPAEMLIPYLSNFKEQRIDNIIKPNEKELRRLLSEM
jgi:uncharacterized protein (TIGR02172 family)